MLDSLLVVKGERARDFRLGLGVDLQQPTAAAALEFITPPLSLFEVGPPLASGSGWLFHIDAKNVLATHWEPVVDDAEPAAASFPPDELPTKGFRVRLLETAGRGCRVTLRTYRPVGAARQIDFLGETMVEAAIENDKIKLDFAAHEWIELEAIWKAEN